MKTLNKSKNLNILIDNDNKYCNVHTNSLKIELKGCVES